MLVGHGGRCAVEDGVIEPEDSGDDEMADKVVSGACGVGCAVLVMGLIVLWVAAIHAIRVML